MDKPLDLSKPLQTRDGRPVTLIATTGRAPYTLIGYIGGDSFPEAWEHDGTSAATGFSNSPSSLINTPEKPPKMVRYLNRYLDGAFFEITEKPVPHDRPELTESIRVFPNSKVSLNWRACREK